LSALCSFPFCSFKVNLYHNKERQHRPIKASERSSNTVLFAFDACKVLSQNANPSCQSLRIGSNTSACPATTNMMRCPRPWVMYQYFVQVQPSLSSRNANPVCQSLRICSNTSDPKASSFTSYQQLTGCVALVLGCCINEMQIQPTRQSLRICSNTSEAKASSPPSNNQHVSRFAYAATRARRKRLHRLASSRYSRPCRREMQIQHVNLFA
jgi:hypothetical protein